MNLSRALGEHVRDSLLRAQPRDSKFRSGYHVSLGSAARPPNSVCVRQREGVRVVPERRRVSSGNRRHHTRAPEEGLLFEPARLATKRKCKVSLSGFEYAGKCEGPPYPASSNPVRPIGVYHRFREFLEPPFRLLQRLHHSSISRE